MGTVDRTRGRYGEVRAFIGEVYGPDLRAKRIDSLAGVTLQIQRRGRSNQCMEIPARNGNAERARLDRAIGMRLNSEMNQK
jgi:hypothetical protein